MENEERIKDETPEETAVSVPDKERPRYRWIDQARGFIMFLLIVTLVFPPKEWAPEGSVLFWLFAHPSADATYMTFFDIGAAAFIFVLGMLFTVSFTKRKESKGTKGAILYVLKRYGLILLLGLIITAADQGITKEKEGLMIIGWDVLPTLGLIGFIAIPFAYIKDNKLRLIIAYAWIVLYQILMNFAGLKRYAQLSVHGGIFGTIFGFSGIMVIAACLGEYMFLSNDPEQKKYKMMALFGLINFVVGLILSYIPTLEASKRQVSLSYCLICIGVTVIFLIGFIALDKVFNKEIKLFTVYGKNPFFVYFLGELPTFSLRMAGFLDLGMGPIGLIIMLVILVTYITAILFLLEKKGKSISTEKATLIFLIVVLVLAPILLLTGVI